MKIDNCILKAFDIVHNISAAIISVRFCLSPSNVSVVEMSSHWILRSFYLYRIITLILKFRVSVSPNCICIFFLGWRFFPFRMAIFRICRFRFFRSQQGMSLIPDFIDFKYLKNQSTSVSTYIFHRTCLFSHIIMKYHENHERWSQLSYNTLLD